MSSPTVVTAGSSTTPSTTIAPRFTPTLTPVEVTTVKSSASVVLMRTPAPLLRSLNLVEVVIGSSLRPREMSYVVPFTRRRKSAALSRMKTPVPSLNDARPVFTPMRLMTAPVAVPPANVPATPRSAATAPEPTSSILRPPTPPLSSRTIKRSFSSDAATPTPSAELMRSTTSWMVTAVVRSMVAVRPRESVTFIEPRETPSPARSSPSATSRASDASPHSNVSESRPTGVPSLLANPRESIWLVDTRRPTVKL